MALLELRLIFKNKTSEEKLKVHAFFVGMFLIVSHVAMIFGMVDPMLGTAQGMANMNM